LQEACRRARKLSGLGKPATVHVLLGHTQLATTER